MNSILDYHGFKEDVTEFVGNTLLEFGMVVDTELFEKGSYHPNTHIFYSNQYATIELNTLFLFPYENSVGFEITLKGDNATIKMSPYSTMNEFLNIDKNSGHYNRIWSQYLNIDNPEKLSRREHYQFSLKRINELLKWVYAPLLIGDYNFDMFLKWKNENGIT